jgi:hypothetical protein
LFAQVFQHVVDVLVLPAVKQQDRLSLLSLRSSWNGQVMTKQILFIQGGGAGTHDDWDSKLVASLARELGQGYDIRYPRMPNEADPSYPAWKTALEHEIAALDDAAILVGHSLGGTILINALAEQAPVRKLAGSF